MPRDENHPTPMAEVPILHESFTCYGNAIVKRDTPHSSPARAAWIELYDKSNPKPL